MKLHFKQQLYQTDATMAVVRCFQGQSLPTGINKDNFGKESIRRNLILADLFHRMGKVERMGTGIEKMKNLMLDAKLDEPVFTSDSFFHTAFYRSPEYALKPVAEKSVQKSTQKGVQKSTQKILEIIAHNNFVTRAELAQQIGLSESGVKKQLRKLQEEGVLKRIGPDKGGHWEVVDKD